MSNSKDNRKGITDLNKKLSDILNDRCMLAHSFLSLLSETTTAKHTSQIKLVKDPQSNRVYDLLIKKTKHVTLYDNLIIFLDTDKKFQLKGDLLEMITNKDYNDDLANLSYKNYCLKLRNKCILMKKLRVLKAKEIHLF